MIASTASSPNFSAHFSGPAASSLAVQDASASPPFRAAITAGLAKVIGTDSGFGSILKFDYEGAGVTRVDGKNVPNSVTNEDGPADCTIVISAENLMKMFKREPHTPPAAPKH